MSPDFFFTVFFPPTGSYNKKRASQPDPRVQNQSLFCTFMTTGENHIQNGKSFRSWKKRTQVRDLMIEDERRVPEGDWGHNILPPCHWVHYDWVFLEEVGGQWSERCVWTFSRGPFFFDLRSRGCPLKSGFPMLMSCRWLAELSCDHSSFSFTCFANCKVEVL